jgi:hypothetical protein
MLVRRFAMTHAARLASVSVLLLGGCSIDGVAILPGLGLGPVADDESGTDESGDGDGDSQATFGDDDGESLDLPQDEETPFAFACSVHEDSLDAAPPCGAQPPSDVLAPEIAWTWTGPNGEHSVLVTPLVANLDDDNGDERVDPCDRPDILVLAVDAPASKDEVMPPGHLYLLDSISGETKRVFDYPVDATATPALADLDDDGIPEILALEVSDDQHRRVVALRADGSVAWQSELWMPSLGGGALSIADLDANGVPEILAPDHVLAADGSLLWIPPEPPVADSLPFAADLDLDGDLEVLFGRSVYEHDGTLKLQLALAGNVNTGVSAVANFDDDPYPEIYVHSFDHRVFEHDGALKAQCIGTGKTGPASIVDTNGDGRAEILANHGAWFRASEIVEDDDDEYECVPLWSVKVTDGVGTAFDFLGDGSAEPIYADVDWVRIYDEHGVEIASFNRSARPSMATPVVADADNDGAAELIIVASEPYDLAPDQAFGPSVTFVHNSDDRFAPTRRIWNQHAYHATNVREDARVPIEHTAEWMQELNSFRINPAPTYAGDQCQNPAFP